MFKKLWFRTLTILSILRVSAVVAGCRAYNDIEDNDSITHKTDSESLSKLGHINDYLEVRGEIENESNHSCGQNRWNC